LTKVISNLFMPCSSTMKRYWQPSLKCTYVIFILTRQWECVNTTKELLGGLGGLHIQCLTL
jgi:hypothetical protein